MRLIYFQNHLSFFGFTIDTSFGNIEAPDQNISPDFIFVKLILA